MHASNLNYCHCIHAKRSKIFHIASQRSSLKRVHRASPSSKCLRLRQRLVPTSLVRLAIREEEVDENSEEREEEDEETPQELVTQRAVRLRDLDCGFAIVSNLIGARHDK